MDLCRSPITITNQADIDHGVLSSSCVDSAQVINIRNATDTLNFSRVTSVWNITVYDSPQLQALEFPNLTSLYSLEITRAISLTNISLPIIYAGATLELYPDGGYSGHGSQGTVPSLNITGAPALENLRLGNTPFLGNLVLLDSGQSNLYLDNTTLALSILTDRCLELSGLTRLFVLQIHGAAGCIYELQRLTSVTNFTLTNAVDIDTVDDRDDPSIPASLQVNDTMNLESSLASGEGDLAPITDLGTADTGNEIGLRRIKTIVRDLNINSNTNVHIAYDGLTSVGASLSARGNTNCTFNFDQLSMVGNLVFIDNFNTTLPLFPLLERANNIHLRGFIDTSVGPNIFPYLKSIPGNVTVEAWNGDFDCSKLVAQWNDHTIHNLQCNGTNNGTSNEFSNRTDTSTPAPSHGLSQGKWAGIGVAIGIVVIGIILALIWLVLHFRRRLRELERIPPQKPNDNETSNEPNQPQTNQTQEMDGASIRREKPDDPLVEMPTQPTELPTSL
ncbi:hypothetical protein F5Y19DRAFT_474782 [Xylariaceae sp. FL1651]|nr:hypothetical protein F5Y19DRAFT_474782 [Xylariaceae sp. FL1651]